MILWKDKGMEFISITWINDVLPEIDIAYTNTIHIIIKSKSLLFNVRKIKLWTLCLHQSSEYKGLSVHTYYNLKYYKNICMLQI